jgi:hypothetical protein
MEFDHNALGRVPFPGTGEKGIAVVDVLGTVVLGWVLARATGTNAGLAIPATFLASHVVHKATGTKTALSGVSAE